MKEEEIKLTDAELDFIIKLLQGTCVFVEEMGGKTRAVRGIESKFIKFRSKRRVNL